MRFMSKTIPLFVLAVAVTSIISPVFADEPSTSGSSKESTPGGDSTNTKSTESSFSYSSSSSSSSSSTSPSSDSSASSSAQNSKSSGSTPSLGLGLGSGSSSSSSTNTSPTVIRKFLPKFKERLLDLADQVKMAQTKGWITADEAAKFMERQTKLLPVEAEASKKGFPQADVDNLERAITLLNGDLFKAMRKADPVKPGPAESEVNDPNLIPAYSDPELQPNSGKR